MVLNDIAIKYLAVALEYAGAITVGKIVVGFIAGAIFTRTKYALLRAPYFAYSWMLTFLFVAAGFIWFGIYQAMAGGYLWALVAVDVTVGLLFGFFLGVFSKQRSLDAFGTPSWAWLGLIPIANFVLLLMPSKEVLANRAPTIRLVRDGLGVVTGFVIMAVATVLSGVLNQQLSSIETNDPMAKAASFDFFVRTEGLHDVLTAVAEADGASVPTQIDELTTLTAVEAVGATLRYHFTVDVETDLSPEAVKSSIVREVCSEAVMLSALVAGATLELHYETTGGREIATFSFTEHDCSI